jgi:TIR domain/Photosynthesis system II assembly factor YCF48
VAQGAPAAFFSYCRDDSEFALRLAEGLKAAGANVWIDQLDIEPGMPWDRAVESAVTNCPLMLVILSPTSVNSDNVRDEISFALSKQKRVIPVLYRECDVPFRLARLQHLDFRTDYARGLKALLKTLGIEQQAAAAGGAAVSAEPKESQPEVSGVEEGRHVAERARLEEERKQAEERARLEEEGKQATEQVRVAQERTHDAEKARLEEERRKSAKRAERTKPVREQAEGASQKKWLSVQRNGASIGAGAIILIIALGSWLVHYNRSLAPHGPDIETAASEHWRVRISVTQNYLQSIFGTTDGRLLWAVGGKGTILESVDGGEHWNALNSGTSEYLNSVFGTSDGKRLWAVANSGIILESYDGGKYWNARNSGTAHLHYIFGTKDGKRLWAVGTHGTILEGVVQ